MPKQKPKLLTKKKLRKLAEKGERVCVDAGDLLGSLSIIAAADELFYAATTGDVLDTAAALDKYFEVRAGKTRAECGC